MATPRWPRWWRGLRHGLRQGLMAESGFRLALLGAGLTACVMVPVDTDFPIKRKYVEVMARSMPVDITTQSGESPGDELVFNKVQRHQTANFSFSILHDPSPKGAAWLAKVRREN